MKAKLFDTSLHIVLIFDFFQIPDWWMGHWRRSVENLWIMRKVFFYLLFMVLILPSMGLTSLDAFLRMIIEQAQNPDHSKPNNYTVKWNCIFLPDNGAFFVNYVVTSALVGMYYLISEF